jgi:bifunctional enzyme CysN/CysC
VSREWHHFCMSHLAVRGLTVWLTGLPGSGKTTSADYLLKQLESQGVFTASLDGDVLRSGVSSDLGFSDDDRDENVRRAGEVALLLASQGAVVVVSLVSPRRAARDAVRARHDERAVDFLEVHVAAPLEVCEARDPKSLYRRAREGSVAHMTGVHDPYEAPLHADLVLATDRCSVEETGTSLVAAVETALRSR